MSGHFKRHLTRRNTEGNHLHYNASNPHIWHTALDRSFDTCQTVQTRRMAGQQYSNEDYTIGWICALPKTELVATIAILDERHLVLPAANLQNTNTYLFSRNKNHSVVITHLPAETTGKVSTTTIATNIIHNFPSIRFTLMVGIGNRVPYIRHREQDTNNSQSTQQIYRDEEGTLRHGP